MDCRKEVLKNIRRLKPVWDQRLGEDHLVNLSVLGQISSTALTQEGLPNTFVPGET